MTILTAWWLMTLSTARQLNECLYRKSIEILNKRCRYKMKCFIAGMFSFEKSRNQHKRIIENGNESTPRVKGKAYLQKNFAERLEYFVFVLKVMMIFSCDSRRPVIYTTTPAYIKSENSRLHSPIIGRQNFLRYTIREKHRERRCFVCFLNNKFWFSHIIILSGAMPKAVVKNSRSIDWLMKSTKKSVHRVWPQTHWKIFFMWSIHCFKTTFCVNRAISFT